MACSITILDANITDLDVMSIEVSGQAQDCDSVIVGLSCTDPGGPFVEVTASVDGSGNWIAMFPDGSAAGCSCVGVDQISLFAVARCADQPDCIGQPSPFKKALSCTRCPAIIVSEPELAPSAECNPDGTISVTLKTEVVNNTNSAVVTHIECGPGGTPDPGTLVTQILPGNADQLVQVCKYTTPVTPEPFVTIDVPDGCPDVPIEVGHQICCPDPATIEVTPKDCVNGKRRVEFDLGGTFSGTINFGDGDSQSFTASVISHDYAVPPNSYTAVLSVNFCEDMPIPVSGLEPCPQPDGIGACCLPDESCVETTEAECRAQGGSFKGVGTSCSEVDCRRGNGPPHSCGSLFCIIFGIIFATLLAGYLIGVASGTLSGGTEALALAALTAYSGFYISQCGLCCWVQWIFAGLALFVVLLILLLIFGSAPGLISALTKAAGFLVAALILQFTVCREES